MTFKALDGLTRYHVVSERDPNIIYLVDLCGYNGNGMCSCPHFLCKLEKRLKDGERAVDDTLRCKHIREVRRGLGNELLDELIRSECQKEKKPQQKRIT